MSQQCPTDPADDLQLQLTKAADLLARVTHLLRQLAPDDLPTEPAADAPLVAAALQLLPVVRQIYLRPATLAVKSLILALAGEDSDTDQALDLLRQLISTEIQDFRCYTDGPCWPSPSAGEII